MSKLEQTEKDFEITMPSAILKMVLQKANLALLGLNPSNLVTISEEVKVFARLVGAIPYFTLEGLRDWKFAYKYEGKVYAFKTKDDMTKAIHTLSNGVNLANTVIPNVQLTGI